jgi:hypothetical protein
MALVDSNTYIEPTAGTALNSARSQINNSLRSILTNFKIAVAPSLLTYVPVVLISVNKMVCFLEVLQLMRLYISDSTQC